MNLLLIEKIGITDVLKQLIAKRKLDKWEIITIDTMEEYDALCKNSKFDIIILDFSTKYNLEFYSYIKSKNLKQKFLFIDNGISQRHFDCLNCKFNRTLLFPINENELYEMIVNYTNVSCPYSGIFDVIDEISCYYQYKRENNSLVITDDSDLEQVVEDQKIIMQVLKNLKISYKLHEDHSIELL